MEEPPEIVWEEYRGLALPSSPLSGPVKLEGTVARCFARTQTGALLAATQISSRAVLGVDWRSVVERQLVPGPGAEAHVKKMEGLAGTDAARSGSDVAGLLQPAGFRVLTYTADQATVALVYGSELGRRLQSMLCTVVWTSGDWFLQPEPNGEIGALVQRPDSLEGFVPWGKG
ncbi:hypothetical protein OG216_46230 (plasmid) [Streptomycetaceae bacterium NBC_01309]